MSSRGDRFLLDASAALTASADVPDSSADRPAASWLERLKLKLNSDEELAAKLREGQHEALTVLFERHSAQVFRHSRRILRNDAEAEDVVQQVFLDLLHSIDQFDPSKASFKTWLMMFAYCRTVNRWRQLQARHYYDTASIEDILPAILEGAQQSFPFRTAEAVCLVEQALRLVQSRQRRTIELIYYEGLTPEEVADKTGESLPIVRHNLYRGLEKLRSVLGAAAKSETQGRKKNKKAES